MNELRASAQNIILVIDEIHTLVARAPPKAPSTPAAC